MSLFRGKGARRDGTVEVPGVGTTPLDVRKAESAYWASTGVVPGGASPLVTGTAGWAYSVGKAHFVTSRSESDGHQVYGNDGAVTIGTTGVGSTVPVAPGAGLSRIDIIWTRHPTNLENADTSSEPLFGVESGTAAAPGLPPTIPVGASELARNTMTSAATTTASAGNTITQTALEARLRGPLNVNYVRTGPAGPFSALTQGLLTPASVMGDGVRKFKIGVHIRSASGTVATDVFDFHIQRDGVTIASHTSCAGSNAVIIHSGITFFTVDTPSVGAHAYTLAAALVNGTGILTLNATATQPMDMTVEVFS